MELQVCHYEPPTMVDRPIKIEREEDDDSCENSETEIPCVSTVPLPADKNTGSYYYPSQAVVAPRTPMYTTVGKMAQKRKTVQALVQVSFEETLFTVVCVVTSKLFFLEVHYRPIPYIIAPVLLREQTDLP